MHRAREPIIILFNKQLLLYSSTTSNTYSALARVAKTLTKQLLLIYIYNILPHKITFFFPIKRLLYIYKYHETLIAGNCHNNKYTSLYIYKLFREEKGKFIEGKKKNQL